MHQREIRGFQLCRGRFKVFWQVTPYQPVDSHSRFKGELCLQNAITIYQSIWHTHPRMCASSFWKWATWFKDYCLPCFVQ